MINWTTYIAENNPQGVNSVLIKNGLPTADKHETEEAISILIKRKGNKAVIDLMKVHPDYDIIKDIVLDETGNKKTKNTIITELPKEQKTGINIPEIPKIPEQTRDLIIIAAVLILLYKVW